MQCVILAGGRGTRMEPVTSQIPKALIPVAGKPFLDHQLTHLAKTGVTDVLLLIGYLGDQIQAHVKEGEAWNLRVTCIDEGQPLRGTAGALRLALEKGALQPEFLLTYGDALLPIDFSNVWRYFQTRAETVLMTVFKNDNRWGESNAIFDGTKVTLYQKGVKNRAMNYIDYGLLGIHRALIEKEVPKGASDLAGILSACSRRGDIAGLEVTTRFYEIGTPKGLNDLSKYLEGAA